ncbi:MAG: hypothetical protein Q9166_004066 [cf. Caloplaca sp. 2 TL-2023]
MAIITSSTIIRALSLFHLSLSYFLITSPSTIVNQNLVFILGASMQLSAFQILKFLYPFRLLPSLLTNSQPTTSSFSIASPSTALSALILALLGISDLTACSLPEEVSSYYWGSQAPIRCTFFFALTGYAYAFKPKGPIRGASQQSSPWDSLNTSVVFTWSFLEMISWFWIFITLREERRELAVRKVERKRAEENRL